MCRALNVIHSDFTCMYPIAGSQPLLANDEVITSTQKGCVIKSLPFIEMFYYCDKHHEIHYHDNRHVACNFLVGIRATKTEDTH